MQASVLQTAWSHSALKLGLRGTLRHSFTQNTGGVREIVMFVKWSWSQTLFKKVIFLYCNQNCSKQSVFMGRIIHFCFVYLYFSSPHALYIYAVLCVIACKYTQAKKFNNQESNVFYSLIKKNQLIIICKIIDAVDNHFCRYLWHSPAVCLHTWQRACWLQADTWDCLTAARWTKPQPPGGMGYVECVWNWLHAIVDSFHIALFSAH